MVIRGGEKRKYTPSRLLKRDGSETRENLNGEERKLYERSSGQLYEERSGKRGEGKRGSVFGQKSNSKSVCLLLNDTKRRDSRTSQIDNIKSGFDVHKSKVGFRKENVIDRNESELANINDGNSRYQMQTDRMGLINQAGIQERSQSLLGVARLRKKERIVSIRRMDSPEVEAVKRERSRNLGGDKSSRISKNNNSVTNIVHQTTQIPFNQVKKADERDVEENQRKEANLKHKNRNEVFEQKQNKEEPKHQLDSLEFCRKDDVNREIETPDPKVPSFIFKYQNSKNNKTQNNQEKTNLKNSKTNIGSPVPQKRSRTPNPLVPLPLKTDHARNTDRMKRPQQDHTNIFNEDSTHLEKLPQRSIDKNRSGEIPSQSIPNKKQTDRRRYKSSITKRGRSKKQWKSPTIDMLIEQAAGSESRRNGENEQNYSKWLLKDSITNILHTLINNHSTNVTKGNPSAQTTFSPLLF